VGCSGVITHVERQPDGRYNIVLRGIDRFRIDVEDHSKSYRRATVETLPQGPLDDHGRLELRRLRERLESLIVPTLERVGAEPPRTSAMPDEDLVNALAQYLDLDPVEKQALLETEHVVARASALVELLDMRLLMPRTPGHHGVAH
jgi:Lon protease-like protein